MPQLYYTAPNDECFNELKKAAIDVWNTYDDTYGYAAGKIERIKDIGNISDNFMYMVAMFDSQNQAKLASILSPGTRKEVRDRMIDGGSPLEYIVF